MGIAQDRDGFLWIATADGLMRFDGLHYEAVRSPGARDVDVSPDGSVWLATHDGVVRYKRGVFTCEITGHAITALIVTHAGQLLAATDKDLYIAVNLDKEPLKWSLYRHASVHGRFQADLEGNIWFGCGLKLCEWSDDDIRAVAGGADWHKYRKPPPNHIGAIKDQQRDWADIVGTPEHRIWARNGPEVIEFNGAETIRRDVPVETFQGVRPGFLLDHVGRLWIPGRRLHVVENGRLEVFQPGGAPLEDVTTVFEDRRGTLWFGLAGKGLAALPAQTMLEWWGESEGIAGSVLDLAVSPRGGLLAAGYSGAYVLDAKGGRWHRLSAEHGALRATLAEAGGSILQIPFAGGLLRDGREIPLPEGFNRKRMRYLYRDPKGTVWIASIDGLFRLDGRITHVPLPAKKLYPSDMIADADGRLWVGYEGGVAVCAEGNCTQAIAPGDGLASPKIRTIAVSPDAVWVGYRPSIGFTRFRRKPGGWAATQFPPEKGYGPVDTHFLRRDRRGWIWRGSTDGVYICDGVHMEPEDWLHLTFGEEVNASYANMYGWLEQADGDIWIGTQKGVVRVHPAADWFPIAPPRVSPIPTSLRVHQNLEIQLSQPGLPPFQSRLFRYRLLPADREWRISANGTVRYAKLAAGRYRLQVAAGAGRAPVEYTFQVESGSWLLWSIGIAGALLTAGAGWAAERWRRFRHTAAVAEEYWREKQEFLERRAAEEPIEAAPDDWSGRTLDGRFLLQKRIAAGGFAAVYRGLDEANGGAAVAVKLLHPLRDNEQWRRRRFVEEVTALQRLHDPGIVEIRYDGEAAPDRPYLVMEFIDGVTLRELLDAGQVGIERAANLLEQIGRALSAAHRAGVLHRDLKPENIMIRDAGRAVERIALIDFGIASLVNERPHEHTTKLAGSPAYLAPERWVGLASCRSDIYSLAAIAAEMLSGAPAGELGFCAGDPAAFRDRILRLRPSLPQAAMDLLSAALAYDPEARPADAATFVRDLSQTLADAPTHLQS